jgi:hypothetical protein
MGAKTSYEMRQAIDLVRAGVPVAEAAGRAGVTAPSIYRSKLFKALGLPDGRRRPAKLPPPAPVVEEPPREYAEALAALRQRTPPRSRLISRIHVPIQHVRQK